MLVGVNIIGRKRKNQNIQIVKICVPLEVKFKIKITR